MKYFTPARHLALQDCSSPEAMNAADADWEAAVDQYEAYLDTIKPSLPDDVRQLLEGYYLHDSAVVSMARHDARFDVTLQLVPPPHELLTISYELTAEPTLDEKAFASAGGVSPLWFYEELSAVSGGFQHSILLSNGWELTVPFRDVKLTVSTAIFPIPTRPAAKSA
jgi:hypothetical protein